MAGQIDAAAERQLVVHHDDFLMVGAADRMAVVESEPDLSRHLPPETPPRQRIAFERVERGMVPDQKVATKMRAASNDKGEQLVEPGRGVGRRGPRQEINRSHDVPTQNEHCLAGVEQRLPDQPEIVRAILDAVKSARALDPPAVFPGATIPAAGDGALPVRAARSAVPIIQPPSLTARRG